MLLKWAELLLVVAYKAATLKPWQSGMRYCKSISFKKVQKLVLKILTYRRFYC